MQFLHSMIRTKDEKKSMEFYCDLLGLKPSRRIRLEDCYLQYLLDEKTGVELELTINDETPEYGYKTGDAFGHFAFLCDNLNEVSELLKQKDIKWEIEPFYMDEVKTKIAFLKDPDGNSVELIEKVL